MIYTLRFWQYGQWNYIPDLPVESIEETDKFVEKYGLGNYQVMYAGEIDTIWKIVETFKFK